MEKEIWVLIECHVNDKLETKNIYEISSYDFQQLFNLERYFYDDLIEMAYENKPPFKIGSPDKDTIEEGLDFLIRFTKI